MTNKEAVQEIEFIFENVYGLSVREREALETAIEALKNQRPHGTCKTCKHYVTYIDQFSYGYNGYRGDGYCKSDITNSEGRAYINCHDEWYCANYEKEGEAE